MKVDRYLMKAAREGQRDFIRISTSTYRIAAKDTYLFAPQDTIPIMVKSVVRVDKVEERNRAKYGDAPKGSFREFIGGLDCMVRLIPPAFIMFSNNVLGVPYGPNLQEEAERNRKNMEKSIVGKAN